MQIRTLETAVALAQLETFSATALHLNITQAAVSMRISALENEVGRELFIRRRRGVTLTETGVTFIEGAKQIIATYHQTMRACGVGADESEFRVGMLSSLADVVASGLIRALAERNSDMAIKVETASTPTLLDRLQAGHLDIVFGVDFQQRPGLRSDFLCNLDMEWVQSPGFDNRCEHLPITPAEIAKLPILTYRQNSTIHDEIRSYLKSHDAARIQFIYCDNLPTLLQFAREGIGIAPITRLLAQREVQAGRLVVVASDPPPPSFRYRVYASNRIDARLYSTMMEVARQEVNAALSMGS
jgi:DNA-binding transcriptional LysR family regulator